MMKKNKMPAPLFLVQVIRILKSQMYTHIKGKYLVVLLCIMVLALALRLINLNMPLWGDETLTWAYSRGTPFIEMLQNAPKKTILYYALMHFTISAFGITPWAMRILSVFFGIAILPLVYWGMREASFSKEDSLISTLLVATSSMLIYYSQEARAYSMLAFLGVLSLILLFRCFQNPIPINLVLYSISLILIAYTFRYGFLLVGGFILCALLYRHWRLATITLIFSTVINLDIFINYLQKSSEGITFKGGASGDPTDIKAITSLVNSLTTGTLGMQTITKIPNAHSLKFPIANVNFILPVIGALIIGLILFIFIKNRKLFSSLQKQFIDILAISILIPILLALILGSPILPKPQWLLRGLIYIWPLYFMFLTAAASKSKAKIYLIAVVVLLNIISLLPYYTIYKRFIDVTAFDQLNTQVTEKDLVIADPFYMYNLIDYYYDGSAPMVGYHPTKGWIDIEQMAFSNDFGLIPIEENPNPIGDIFFYYGRFHSDWIESYPNNRIFFYNSKSRTWTEY